MRVRLMSILLLFGLLAGSCGAVRPEPLAFVDQDARPGQSVLRVITWDATALAPAIEQWETEHPTARVVVEVRPSEAHHADILDDSTAAADIVALDSGHIEDFRNRTDLFVDLAPLAETLDDGLPWRSNQGIADDGTITSVAVNTGGLVLAARTDLLSEVDDPNSAGTLLTALESADTWCDVIGVGDDYSDAAQEAFLPSAADLFEAVLNQGDVRFVDADGQRVHTESQAVRTAWETAMLAIGTGRGDLQFTEPCDDQNSGIQRITAFNQTALTPRWSEGLQNGEFAVTIAPSWMLDRIRTTAPETAGNWTLLPIPGTTGTSGGASLAVSQSSEHPDLAIDLIEHLTRGTIQSATFRDFGNLPAVASQYTADAVLDHREPFFGSAAIGELFISSVERYEPAPSAEHDQVILREFRAAVARVDAGTQTPQQAWDEAVWRVDLFISEN